MQVIEQLKAMKEDRFLAIYEQLAQDGYGPLDGEVAKVLKFRPLAIKKLPMEKRAKTAQSLLIRGGNAELCYELFGTYLMTKTKDLVIDFLDGTDVQHEEGMVQNIEEQKPAGDKVAATVAELDKKYDVGDVTLYLSMAAEQWPSVPEVDSVWRMRG
ncbi:hypothetical protein Poly30_12220 [Planctomycetes bacterium Poly30]|uniref:Uncharacterized protein n=1 Tax=Saltatorellus ferox TaxID=2528018 RepID=A0A518ENQ5_9BACT|nr:hypothetical protein Poly30_12220 [Planctomycetes bacterium Poly30]